MIRTLCCPVRERTTASSFETPRLRVFDWHQIESEDGPELPGVVRHLLSDAVTNPLPEVWHGPYSEERARAWIRDRDSEGSSLLVTSEESGEAIGLLLLHESEDSLGPQLRVGYIIAETHWGKGFATEVLHGLVQWAQDQPYHSIVAGVAADNEPSRRVLEKCGFSRIQDDHGEELFYALRLSCP